MRFTYAMRVNVRAGKYGKRPTSTTPIEPMLIPLGNDEVLAVCVGSDIWAPETTAGNVAEQVTLNLDPKCAVTMEIRPNGGTQECVVTIKMPLE